MTQPENARFQYVLGVALASNGDVDQGIEVLVTALSVSPFDRDVLTALATYSRDSGDTDGAIIYAERLVEVTLGDPGTIELLRQLRAGSR
jgi:Flp pilus assembly protein TadD